MDVIKRPLHSLTSVRFVAAACVVLFHLHYETWQHGVHDSQIGLNWFQKGYLGVDFFFVLSGFILCYAHPDLSGGKIDRHAIGNFVFKRFSRIYPSYFAALVLFVAITLLKPLFDPALIQLTEKTFYGRWVATNGLEGDWSARLLMNAVFMLQAAGLNSGAWNGPGWSVSAEIFTYCLFPLFWAALRSRENITYILAMVLTTALLGIFEHAHSGTLHVFEGWIILRCLLDTSIGVSTYYLYQKRFGKKLFRNSWALVFSVACLLIFVRFNHRLHVFDTLFVPVFALVILSLAYKDSVSAFVRPPPA